MKNGKIVQVMGPVIDVEFEDELPKIKDALEVELDGKKLVMEVSQHIGGNCVRCIMLAASEGLSNLTFFKGKSCLISASKVTELTILV